MTDQRARLNRLLHPTPHPYAPPLGEWRPSGALGGAPQPIEALLPGYSVATESGAAYVIPTQHPPDHVHGSRALTDWLGQDLAGAAAFSRESRFGALDPRRCLFLDTETTGLSAGAGTLVFLVGIGLFTDQGFEVRQFFLRDPHEEPAMLDAILALLSQHDAIVTFNGRSFDVPLLASRYTLNRQRVRLDNWPNLDLLHPARRLWKRRLPSCRLSALETAILGVRRTGEDVPGWLIPQMYHDYIRSGDARPMAGVIYHNLIDVLSMVTLAVHLCETFAQPERAELPCDDLISLARWYDSLGKSDQAESAYAGALAAAQHPIDRAAILDDLAGLLKRSERWDEAAACWEGLAALRPAGVEARIELAKYHEWHTHDLDQARGWTEEALRLAGGIVSPMQREATLVDLQHRLERLTRKA